MYAKKILGVCALVLCSVLVFTACNSDSDSSAFTNPQDYLGGGGEVTVTPTESDSENVVYAADTVAGNSAEESVPTDAIRITGKTTVSEAGNYYVDSEISGKITVESDGVVLYLCNAALSNDKKVIESSCSLTITLFGDNSVSNSNEEGSNAIDCAGELVINGSGTLSVYATKNAVRANSVSVVDATLDIVAEKDGIHAEIDAYDDATL